MKILKISKIGGPTKLLPKWQFRNSIKLTILICKLYMEKKAIFLSKMKKKICDLKFIALSPAPLSGQFKYFFSSLSCGSSP